MPNLAPPLVNWQHGPATPVDIAPLLSLALLLGKQIILVLYLFYMAVRMYLPGTFSLAKQAKANPNEMP